jgi:uncharacterized protein (DUF2236 family)
VPVPRTETASTQPLGPDSLVWRLGFSRTSLLYAGRALYLQVSHPVVGAGVRDFSSFTTDPWGRLDRTLRSLQTQMFGGPAAVAEGERLRRLHRAITGVGFDGSRYSALLPEAWAWVHLSNFDSAVRAVNSLQRRLSTPEHNRLYTEWRQIGSVIGVREDLMPATYRDVAPYIEHMIAERLTGNDTSRELLETLSMSHVEPPSSLVPAALWRAVTPIGGSVLHDFTVGTLPRSLREAHGLAWDADDERRLARRTVAIRAAARVTPARILHYPAGYRALRAARSAGPRSAVLRPVALAHP